MLLKVETHTVPLMVKTYLVGKSMAVLSLMVNSPLVNKDVATLLNNTILP